LPTQGQREVAMHLALQLYALNNLCLILLYYL
jgi:hypothetical protein